MRTVEWCWGNVALEDVEPLRFTAKKDRWRNYRIIAWLEDNIEEAAPTLDGEYRRSINDKWAINKTAYDDYSAHIEFSDDVPEETIMMFVLKFA
jgi:hypothetical protein